MNSIRRLNVSLDFYQIHENLSFWDWAVKAVLAMDSFLDPEEHLLQ